LRASPNSPTTAFLFARGCTFTAKTDAPGTLVDWDHAISKSIKL
jgi:hypothetical protein